VKNGALLVGLDHPAWLQQMQMQQRRIVKMVQQQFPALEIRYLHLMVVDKLDPSVRPDVSPEQPSSEGASEAAGTGETEGQSDGDHESVEDAPDDEIVTASEDPDFLARLERLGEAIRRKNPE
jgi:hypothetical protein